MWHEYFRTEPNWICGKRENIYFYVDVEVEMKVIASFPCYFFYVKLKAIGYKHVFLCEIRVIYAKIYVFFIIFWWAGPRFRPLYKTKFHKLFRGGHSYYWPNILKTIWLVPEFWPSHEGQCQLWRKKVKEKNYKKVSISFCFLSFFEKYYNKEIIFWK